MQTHTRNLFTSIHSEGALLPPDLLQRILDGDQSLAGLTPGDYHLPKGEKLNEAVNRAWSRLQTAWASFQNGRQQLRAGDPGTTLTRERWLLPLFQELGYGRLASARAVEIEGKSYPVSHNWGSTPIHLVGCGVELDTRSAGVAGAARTSPHSLLQELLNRDDDRQWGLLSNGLRLRVLRDNLSLTRMAYLEFDLEAMFVGDIYADFVLLWLLCHQSRFESPAAKGEACWLEKWSQAAQEQGTRALDQLRAGVEEAIAALGSGFLAHPANQALLQKLRSGELDSQDFFRQLLRLVYRLIFLFSAEDRDLLLDPEADPVARQRYLRYYSTLRLRRLAERQRGGRHADLWQGLLVVTNILGGNAAANGENRPPLGLPVLNGLLFSDQALPDLEASQLANLSLLSAVRSLAFTVEGKVRRSVDYKNLGPEELGSVYEALLELHPRLNTDAHTFELISVSGSERKTTGSYYTPASLIRVLLDSALDPVIEQAVKNAGPSAEDQQSALLSLKICDPACGSGAFLIAAAHRIARRLAQVRQGGDEPSPGDLRHALREVIGRCIYGVDLNPMAVELCKVNLWLEALEPGKPLSFLDAHIQCGDSLVGVGPGLDISEIPDDAFKPAFGDDKPTAAALRKRNQAERRGQMGLDVFLIQDQEGLEEWLLGRLQQVDRIPDERLEDLHAKAQSYRDYLNSPQYRRRKLEADLWTSAFFWPIQPSAGEAGLLAPTQEMLRRLRSGAALPTVLEQRVNELADQVRFFHWELGFPQVFACEQPGFDCVLGNPPWERIKLQEEEFFAARDPDIVQAITKAARQSLIDALPQINQALWQSFQAAKHAAEATSKFVRLTGRFQLTAVGDVNTYALFAEHARNVVSRLGRVGIIVPIGIATDDTTKVFFGELVDKKSLIKMIGFENEAFIFPAIHHSTKFCCLIMGSEMIWEREIDFIFFCRYLGQLKDELRHFLLSPTDIARINPNTRTCPIFRTRIDAELTRKTYKKVPILENERTGENHWKISFSAMFHMSNDSALFSTTLKRNYVRLYEAKMFSQFDHRYGTYEGATQAHLNLGNLPQTTETQKQDAQFLAQPRYWIPINSLNEKVVGWNFKWFLGFRDITSSISERTAIFSILPFVGVGNNAPLLMPGISSPLLIACLLCNFNMLVFDYFARQKIAGVHMNFFLLKQLPPLSPVDYSSIEIAFTIPRMLELVYTSWDIQSFADDVWHSADQKLRTNITRQWEGNSAATIGGHSGTKRPDWSGIQPPDGFPHPPFNWDEDRRSLLRAELDAYYARLYGLNRKQLRYILDPADLTPRELEDILNPWEEVSDPLDAQGYDQRRQSSDFPGETFRVLKEKELRLFGEYRTRRLVLEAWERLKDVEIGNPAGYSETQPVAEPTREVIELRESPAAAMPPSPPPEPATAKLAREELEATESQPMLSDFGLYRCEACGKMVMGFDREEHENGAHKRKGVGWKKVK